MASKRQAAAFDDSSPPNKMIEHADWQARIREVLTNSPVFGQLNDTAFDQFVDSLTYLSVTGGAQVLREGDESNSVIIVLSGRLRVWREASDGKYMLYNEIGPGESIGEAGMILQQNRTANVTALRDSLLAVLSRVAFETLLTKQPLAINRVFSQSLYNYLRHSTQSNPGHTCKSYTVIPLHPDCGANTVAESLVRAFLSSGTAQHLRFSSEHRPMASEFSIEEEISHLDQLEKENNFLVLETQAEFSPWILKAVRQSDQIIFVASGHADSRISELEYRLAQVPGFEMKRKHLVLLHPENATQPSAITPWHVGRDVERIYP
ncbi:MAG TPA: cyclic nucleotide-binding domain-containing protein, partial [Gammaproteobacteria bacterium]|nr:cyclic nucleotide-binding domain-containing protein [Gammaproteobacteria bacterium]